jgi:hypothetical protein
VKLSNSKIIITPNAIHLTEYAKPYAYDYKRKPRKANVEKDTGTKTQVNKSFFSLYRAKRQAKLILECNAMPGYFVSGSSVRPLFVTITFAENITDLKTANKEFGNFGKRLNRAIIKQGGAFKTPLKYLVVPEFQKRGAVHYHVVYFAFPAQKDTNAFLSKVWGHGFTFNNTIKSVEHLKNYVTKYFTKSLQDERLAGKKHYFCSKNLLRPTVLKNNQNNEAIISQLNNPNFQKFTFLDKYYNIRFIKIVLLLLFIKDNFGKIKPKPPQN